jgi:hypothetical protein
MDNFWTLLRESVIVQAVISLALVGTYCYLVIVAAAVPDTFVNVLLLVVGFWMGGKTQQYLNSRGTKPPVE